MVKKSISVVAAFALSSMVLAQAIVIGSISDVRGLVTVSDAATVQTVVLNAPVIDGTRYVTSSTGYVTLKLDRNCDVTLRPNQSLVVDQSQSCPALIALIQGTQDFAIAAVGGAGLSNNVAMQLLGGAAILALVGGGSTPTSGGGTPVTPGTPPGGGEGGTPCVTISCE